MADSNTTTQPIHIVVDTNDNIWIEATASDAFLIVNPGVTLWLEGVNVIAPSTSPGKVICYHGNVTLKDVNICPPDGGSGVLLDGSGTLDVIGESDVKGRP